MLITEKILGDIGGWQAMKNARLLVAGGAVEQKEREGDQFRGLVREGKRKFAVSLAIQGPTKADCRCSCADAQRGLVCAHAIALALASILLPAAAVTAGVGRPASAAPVTRAAAAGPSAPEGRPLPPGRCDIYLATARLAGSAGGRGQFPVFIQFQPGGTEIDPMAPWFRQQGLTLQSGPLLLEPAMLGGFFAALRGHPRVWDGRPGASDRAAIAVNDNLEGLGLAAALERPDSVHFTLAGAGPTPAAGTADPILLEWPGQGWLWNPRSRSLAPVGGESAEVDRLIFECLAKKSSGARRDLRWLARNLPALEATLPLATDEALAHLRLVPAEPRFVLQLDGSPRQALAQVEVAIGTVRHSLAGPVDPAETEPYPVAAGDGSLTFWQRNLGRERRVRTELETAGFQPTPEGFWSLRGERDVAEFFARCLPELQRRHEVIFSERWQAAFRGWKRIAPVVRPRDADLASTPTAESARGWLDMEFAYEAADGFRVPRSELLRLLRSGQSTVRGRQGQTYVLDAESCDDFESLLSESGARLGEGGQVALSPENGHVLNAFAAAGQPLAKLTLPDPADVRRRLGDLAGRLRDYQFEGVRWLIATAESGRGCLLADDMGLGKTLQVIALLRWLATCEQPSPCEQLSPTGALVVCPTSLISNWNLELQRFAPDFHVQIYHGTDRVLPKVIDNKFCVILTSYGLVSRDLKEIMQNYYQAVVLDEASYIRNPEAAASKAVNNLRSRTRVALTGTPVENSVQDLWSLMRFVQPGFLGDRKEFGDRYVKPLASAGTDPATAERVARRLRARLGPFVLRRTKKEVVRELPDKIEQVILCDLTPAQKEAYKRLLEEGQAEIRDARRRNPGAARMTMFTVLLRLRQACNDLRLLSLRATSASGQTVAGALELPAKSSGAADFGASGRSQGGKWEPLADILEEALGGMHKVLIFSQFTGMLRLLREELDARDVAYSYLDGSTRDRGAQVAAFQVDPVRRVFLISLKAGGYGLNLTAADHVVLMEPWWNPAVEAQAIDRAHRIGQASVVTASRLIARGTVEERILKLQASKRQLMASAVEDDPLTLPGLTDDDLAALLD